MGITRVLIVDDDLALLQALPEALRLRMAGIQIDTCDTAQEALERIAEVDYDAVISDIKMPGMDGLALLAQIHKLRPSTPTLLITGHGEHDLAVQALRGGAYDFIQKPIDRDYFLASLNRAIHMRQLSRQVEEQRLALERHANELEQIVEERTRELREANKAKDEFLATVSHELRTPLTAILGWAKLLRSGKLDDTASARAIETIERNAKSQAQIIEDILDVSRIITGKLRLDVRNVELVPIIETAIDAVSPAADAKGIRLYSALDPNAGPILGDPDRLQQVVWNLLSNAIKFTPRGGRVTVRLMLVHSRVEITVSDTGQGIETELLPFVFDRFRQGNSSLTRRHGGLGLGLAVVRHLVELHGGSAFAESPGEGKGSTFTVTLPIAAVRLGPRREGELQVGGSMGESSSSMEGLPSLEGFHVLVVDDEADARELLSTMLGQLGAEVRVVGSAAEALAALDQMQPDVLISDIGMPDEDGYSLIQKVRARPPERGGLVPAAALSAYARAEDRTRSILAGFQMHVPKPVDPAELAAVITNLGRRAGKIRA
jgi:signal transduction histidine kinase